MTQARGDGSGGASEARADVWIRPRPDRASYRFDSVVALILAAGMVLTCSLYTLIGFYDDPAPIWLSALLIAVICAPIAVRRRHPEWVVVICALAFFAMQTFRVPELLLINVPLFMAIYSVGAWGRHRLRATIVRVAVIVGMFTWLFIVLATTVPSARLGGDNPNGVLAFGLLQLFINVLYFVGAYYFGSRAWVAARDTAALEMRTVELSHEREVSAAQVIALERVRIARELHDVVAHHVSVMGIQAGAARRVLISDPEAAESALTTVEDSARGAVEELHAMLTTLRSPDPRMPPPASGHSAPSTVGVDQLRRLVDDTAEGGASIQLSIVGDRRELSGVANLTVYRLAQEAITNSLKHAGLRATIDVRLRYLTDEVELEVSDTGRGVAGGHGSGGLGQIGMRERVDAIAGTIEMGPKPRDGYLVRARIPVGSRGVVTDVVSDTSDRNSVASTSTSVTMPLSEESSPSRDTPPQPSSSSPAATSPGRDTQ